jgi:hypothetical protein
LRQAYDYWQNQPGNYPDAPRASAEDGRGRALLQEEGEYVTQKGRPKAPSPQRPASQACSATADHPIAPTEFPQGRSAVERRGLESRCRLLHALLRWREPVPSHAQRRIPVGACPQRSSWDDGHRPRAHRPQKCPLAGANGASAPPCKPATPPNIRRARNKQKRITLPRGPAVQTT